MVPVGDRFPGGRRGGVFSFYGLSFAGRPSGTVDSDVVGLVPVVPVT
jgi:hypothetical protein